MIPIKSLNQSSTIDDGKIGSYLQHGPVIVHPIGDGEDDWPSLFETILANPGREIYMVAGLWTCASLATTPGVTPGAGTIPDGTRIYGAPGYATQIVSSLTPTYWDGSNMIAA